MKNHLLALICLPFLTAACDEAAADEAVTIDDAMLAAFAPLPDTMPLADGAATAEQIALGRKLYLDKRLSINDTLSCNSCHDLDKYGVDNKQFSSGHDGSLGDRNSPTVYNAAGHIAQFWDGRAADVEEQAKGPILNPVEMGMPNADAVVKKLEGIPEYVAAFAKAFPGDAKPLTYDNLGRAIGAFERQLTTPSRWDEFLKGKKDAITNAEKKGFKTFVESGCLTCHIGPYVGGHMYQKLGLIKPWPELKDKGRSKHTGNAAEDYFFKIPSLRNVEKTGPYLHDGSISDLKEMIRLMSRHQVGKELDDTKVDAILTWLKCLTGTP